MPACVSAQGGSHDEASAFFALANTTETPAMAPKQPRPTPPQSISNDQDCATIFAEVETFDDLAPRMQELLLTNPPGTRIYLRLRDRRIINYDHLLRCRTGLTFRHAFFGWRLNIYSTSGDARAIG
jgi:hypothetical protein